MKSIEAGTNMNTANNAANIITNLKDAGCSDDIIDKFLHLLKEGNKAAQIKLLNAHRKSLLDTLHTSQKKIDCLDYLIFSIKQNT